MALMKNTKNPKCQDCRPRCNNRTENGGCIALSETSEQCKFYCSIEDTNPYDYEFHVVGLRKKVTIERKYLEQLI